MLQSGLRALSRAPQRLALNSSRSYQSKLFYTANSKHRVAVIGGYGNFGTRLCNLLAKSTQQRIINSVADKDSTKLEIIILGRDKIKAADLQAQLKTNYPDVTYETFAVDYKDEEKFKSFLKEQRIDTLIHTSGPFDKQTQRQYLVARSCVQNGTNYIDLADDR
jgi:saccharopine dehydrogenase-like NADP-dependent oxidoreductase